MKKSSDALLLAKDAALNCIPIVHGKRQPAQYVGVCNPANTKNSVAKREFLACERQSFHTSVYDDNRQLLELKQTRLLRSCPSDFNLSGLGGDGMVSQ